MDAAQTVTDAAYVWGLDLSGSMQGAGGVGGLISAAQTEGQQATCRFVAYDGNGNVTALVDAADASVVARYDYPPFGMTVLADGSAAAANPWRFSTKYHDTETALAYYGYRYYSPELGRWVNRDPIGERGGSNLGVSCGNDVVGYIDRLGLEWTTVNRDPSKWTHGKGPSYCAREGGETFSDLINRINADFPGTNAKPDDWQCLWPTKPRSESIYTTGTARKGARFDASNVVGNDAPNNLSYAPWARHDWNAISGLLPGLKRAQERSAEDYAADFGSASAEGAHPITYLAVTGHHGVGRTYMFVEDPYQEFNVPEIHSALPAATAQTFEHARDRKGPPRCWFSRKAKVYFVGCNTHYGVSDRFAASFLREGATAWGTDILVGVSGNGATFAGEDTEYTKAGDFRGSSHWLPSNGGL